MFANLREDISRAMYQARPDGWKPSLFQRIEVCFRHSTLPVIAYRFGHWTLGIRIPLVGLLFRIVGLFFRKFVELFTSVHIDVHAKIGPGFVIHSVYAINLGKTTIGRNFTIATGCLISHACRGIGDDVYFGPGAKLVGDARIGSNVTIAANSLVLTDVRDNLMVMGVPARIKLPGGRPQRFLKKTAPAAVPAKAPAATPAPQTASVAASSAVTS
ncbi:MAG: serine O-acetyltransferase [Candidatus Sulfotelmatobacter sp.]